MVALINDWTRIVAGPWLFRSFVSVDFFFFLSFLPPFFIYFFYYYLRKNLSRFPLVLLRFISFCFVCTRFRFSPPPPPTLFLKAISEDTVFRRPLRPLVVLGFSPVDMRTCVIQKNLLGDGIKGRHTRTNAASNPEKSFVVMEESRRKWGRLKKKKGGPSQRKGQRGQRRNSTNWLMELHLLFISGTRWTLGSSQTVSSFLSEIFLAFHLKERKERILFISIISFLFVVVKKKSGFVLEARSFDFVWLFYTQLAGAGRRSTACRLVICFFRFFRARGGRRA